MCQRTHFFSFVFACGVHTCARERKITCFLIKAAVVLTADGQPHIQPTHPQLPFLKPHIFCTRRLATDFFPSTAALELVHSKRTTCILLYLFVLPCFKWQPLSAQRHCFFHHRDSCTLILVELTNAVIVCSYYYYCWE